MLKVNNVNKSYRQNGLLRKTQHQVLFDMNFEWEKGECLGIIGESGSGKSTLGKLLLGIEKPDNGMISFGGKSVTDRRTRRGAISAVFQDYTSSMNPFYTVKQVLLEPLSIMGRSLRSEDMGKVLHQVGLDDSYLAKFPHELSGGEAQRVCIARAIITEPECILLDEAISSLDGSVQMQVLDLLKRLRETYEMGYIFITHDIQAAAYLCDRIMMIRNGRIEEVVATSELKHVQSPYAKELLRKVLT